MSTPEGRIPKRVSLFLQDTSKRHLALWQSCSSSTTSTRDNSNPEAARIKIEVKVEICEQLTCTLPNKGISTAMVPLDAILSRNKDSILCMSREAKIAKPLSKFAAIRTRLSNNSLSLTPCCAGKISGQLFGDASGVDGHALVGLLQVGDVDAEVLLEMLDVNNGNAGEIICLSCCLDKGSFVDGATCGAHCKLLRSASRKIELIVQSWSPREIIS
jgi:hypothetical protein